MLDEVFELFIERYKKILGFFWPTIGDTGFAERNLSTNFVTAYEKNISERGEECISWYEFQIRGESGRNDNHLDAILINLTKREIYLIESKRLVTSQLKKKIKGIIYDIERMMGNNLIEGIGERVENIDSYRIFGCVLTDIWSHNGRSCNNDVITYFKKCSNQNVTGLFLLKELSDIVNYSLPEMIKLFDKQVDVRCMSPYTTSDKKSDYYIISMIWQI